ncbi:WD repeat-containing protein 92 [Rozella allomycis CSF55]|uniref:WD repeat-containing protein 92 n=1 Tax=Rozella allomycis (strain CSF55) TaxID=988480 RepID=A0A4P9YIS9_ROZAC|nr:WD repeat-containing protein 92 [Rozella allomycis CSF55]
MTVTLERPQIIPHLSKSLNYSPFDAKWIPCSAKVVCLGQHPRGTGAIQIYELNGPELKLISESEKPHGFKCGTFGASSLQNRQLATGTLEGHLQVWDIENLSNPVYNVKGHEQVINAIDGVAGIGHNIGAPEIVTGSRDGFVKVWDTRQKGSPVATIAPAENEIGRDCWSVSFGNSYNNEERMVVAGYENGDLKIFDLKTMKLYYETNLNNGVCCAQFDRKDILMNKLVVVGLEGAMNVIDLRTRHSTKGFANLIQPKDSITGQSTIWTVNHLPQNRDIFMTGNGNGRVRLFKYEYPSERTLKDEKGELYGVCGELKLLNDAIMATQPVSSFDWSPDKQGLCAMTSFDQKLQLAFVTKLNQY